MSQTAFSRHFARELDVRQLLKLRGITKTLTQAEYELTPEDRAWMRADLLCPSCRCDGASIVRSDVVRGRGNTRQAHFRFTNPAGQTAHAQGCDFYALNDVAGIQTGVDVSFTANDRDTKVVRELVCKAIAVGELKKTDIFEMRSWFLDQRTAGSFVVRGDVSMVDWLYAMNRRLGYEAVRFELAHATLPGFNPRVAALRDLAFHYRDFRQTLPRVGIDADVRDRTKRIIQRHAGLPLISMEPLRPRYETTVQLARLMVEYGDLPLSKPNFHRGAVRKIPEVLIAFSATLLFVSQWDLPLALRRFATIHNAPVPNDLTAGNVIGLNPFHDFAALELARFISTLTPVPQRIYDFEQELATTLSMILKS